MSIKDQLTVDMKEAMKDRENGKLRLNVIRMVRANIKNVEINNKQELNDDEVLAVLKSDKIREKEKKKEVFSFFIGSVFCQGKRLCRWNYSLVL